MPPFRYRDDDSSTGTTVVSVLLGAIAGFAVGMYVAQRVGGFSGITSRLKRSALRKPEGGDDGGSDLAADAETDEEEADIYAGTAEAYGEIEEEDAYE